MCQPRSKHQNALADVYKQRKRKPANSKRYISQQVSLQNYIKYLTLRFQTSWFTKATLFHLLDITPTQSTTGSDLTHQFGAQSQFCNPAIQNMLKQCLCYKLAALFTKQLLEHLIHYFRSNVKFHWSGISAPEATWTSKTLTIQEYCSSETSKSLDFLHLG